MHLFHKAAQKCWCFSFFKFCLEISLSPWVSLNSTLINSLLLGWLHLECTDVAASLRRFSRSGFGWDGILGNLIAVLCQSLVTGKSFLLSSSGPHQALVFLVHVILHCQHMRISDLSCMSVIVLLTGIKWKGSFADV